MVGYHPAMDRPVISFITDFGGRDPSAAICRGVMVGICPDVQIIDITHDVTKWAVREAAFLLRNSVPHMPVGHVSVGVIDPGVGTTRLGIAIRTGRGDILVGPDNGLLVPAAEALGGIEAVRTLENRDYFHGETTSTFHGRDIFAPMGAHLAAGVPFESVGRPLDPADLVRLPWPGARAVDGGLDTGIVYIDSFGNVKLDAMASDLEAALGSLASGDLLALWFGAVAGAAGGAVPGGPGSNGPGSRAEIAWATTFGDRALGDLLIYSDSFRRLSIAANQASAADRLGVVLDQPVTIRRAGGAGA
jgi:S-adenosylmethionine hydrolase